jgi:hypothetical protein
LPVHRALSVLERVLLFRETQGGEGLSFSSRLSRAPSRAAIRSEMS